MSSLPPELADLASSAELASLASFAPYLAQAFASLACDLALVLDSHGVITRVAHNPGGTLAVVTAPWVGRPLAETVTRETRHKIDGLLRDLATHGLARRREVNLPNAPQPDIPMAYTALRLGPGGPALAVGQDLRAVAQMQQRFLRVQQELERGYGQALREGRAAGPGTAEAQEQLNEASRVAFAAWLSAERLSGDAPPPAAAKPTRARKARRKAG